MPVRGSYDVTAMCLRATGLEFFQICHCVELNKILEAMMPVNPYGDHKFSLWRPHRNGDLDIVGALYTTPKANVTEALPIHFNHKLPIRFTTLYQYIDPYAMCVHIFLNC